MTLSENQINKTTYYYLKFTHRITNQVVEIFRQDLSTKNNVQLFSISSTIFNNKELGFYTYEAKGANNNGTQAVGDVLERGFLFLKKDTTFTPVKYNEQSKQFKTYNAG